MASQDEINQMKSSDFRHCSLCLESYSRSRTPKLLKCFHTFCLPCLTTLTTLPEEPERKDGEDKEEASEDEAPTAAEEPVEEDLDQKEDVSDAESVRSEASVRKYDGKSWKSFPCPACRTPIVIPPQGLLGLQTNFYVMAQLEASADKGPVQCEMCEEGELEDAQHYCHNCQQHMCRACRRLHDRVTGARNHHVESLSNQPAPKLETAVTGMKMCQFHPDQILCFHCSKCDVTICLHCKLTSHEGHDTQDMATAAVQAKGELSGLQARADKQLLLLEACISRLERDELDLNHQKQEVVQQVSSRFDVLIGWATRARDEFLEDVAAKEQASLSDIHMKKASASFFKGNIFSKKMRASQNMSLGSDVVLVKNELQGALLKDEAFEEHQKLAARKEHQMIFRSAAAASVLELAVVRAYMGELIEAPADGSDLPSFSFHEMAQAVTKMEADLRDMKLKNKVPVSKVSFHATQTTNYTCTENQIFLFNNILGNEGGGYSNTTGIFTAPVEGTYIFTTTVRNAADGYSCNAALMVKGTEWARTLTPESSTAHCVASLKKGDQKEAILDNFLKDLPVVPAALFKIMMRKKRWINWDTEKEAMELCLAVYFRSTSAYAVLRSVGFLLPHPRTLSLNFLTTAPAMY
ncbi:hypothetical protein ACOMHN_008604 [Nucella lapillus]